jgi:hypothetical protein
LAQHTAKEVKLDAEKSSSEETNEKLEKNNVNAVIETRGARKEREKAEWERLSFIERIVKKYFPSQINSIAIFVNKYLFFVFSSFNKLFILGFSWCCLCYL